MKNWEKQLMQHILNEKYLGETEQPKMQKEDKKAFLQAVGNYHRLSEMVYRNSALTEVTETLGKIVEQAETLTMQESEHWFDNVTVSRHMKQLKEAYKVFEKTATEMNGLQQRLESAYDDMGTVLNRYYQVGNALSETETNESIDINESITEAIRPEYKAFYDQVYKHVNELDTILGQNKPPKVPLEIWKDVYGLVGDIADRIDFLSKKASQ